MAQKIELYSIWDPRNYTTEIIGLILFTSFALLFGDPVINLLFTSVAIVFFLWLLKSFYDEMKRDQIRKEKKAAK